MKCTECNETMIGTSIAGQYKCPKCHKTIDDLFYREPLDKIGDYGETHTVIKTNEFDDVSVDGTYGEGKTSKENSYIKIADDLIKKTIQYGWVCPKCGAVMSPSQNTCPYCSPPYIIKTYY